MTPNISFHAHKMWVKRFPALDLVEEWDSALPVTKRTLLKIKQSCPKHQDCCTENNWFFAFFMSTSGVIFVYDKTGTVITVFPAGTGGVVRMQNNKAWYEEITTK